MLPRNHFPQYWSKNIGKVHLNDPNSDINTCGKHSGMAFKAKSIINSSQTFLKNNSLNRSTTFATIIHKCSAVSTVLLCTFTQANFSEQFSKGQEGFQISLPLKVYQSKITSKGFNKLCMFLLHRFLSHQNCSKNSAHSPQWPLSKLYIAAFRHDLPWFRYTWIATRLHVHTPAPRSKTFL